MKNKSEKPPIKIWNDFENGETGGYIINYVINPTMPNQARKHIIDVLTQITSNTCLVLSDATIQGKNHFKRKPFKLKLLMF